MSTLELNARLFNLYHGVNFQGHIPSDLRLTSHERGDQIPILRLFYVINEILNRYSYQKCVNGV